MLRPASNQLLTTTSADTQGDAAAALFIRWRWKLAVFTANDDAEVQELRKRGVGIILVEGPSP